jgi:hypothetical protein
MCFIKRYENVFSRIVSNYSYTIDGTAEFISISFCFLYYTLLFSMRSATSSPSLKGNVPSLATSVGIYMKNLS